MNKHPTILIVEDEKHIADLLITNLEVENYQVAYAEQLAIAKQILNDSSIDVILLDIMLPDGSGIDLCQWVKAKYPHIKILMLSALGQSADRIKGLRAGADDYLGKPFDLEELLLRIKLLLPVEIDTLIASQPSIKIGIATINFSEYTIQKDGVSHLLTAKEKGLLEYLYLHKGKVVSRSEILEKVWEYEVYPTSRTVDNYIVKLRHYIESDPNDPQLLTTVRGVGYKLN